MGGNTSISLAGVFAAVLALAAPADASTIEVDTTAQDIALDGDCSFPEAVLAARTNQETFECRKGEATKVDLIRLDAADYSLESGLTLGGGPLIVRGRGSEDTEVDGAEEVRPFRIESGSVTLEKLEVDDGATDDGIDGGNILVQQGRLSLDRVTVLSGSADDGGNVYLEEGTRLNVSRSTIASGTASGDELGSAVGGGIFAGDDSKVTVRRTVLVGNQATHEAVAGGGAIYAAEAKLRLTDTVLLNNEAEASGPGSGASGGAIFAEGPLTVQRSLFSSNSADIGASTSIGGAISVAGQGPISIVNSTLESNEADQGGALRANGPVSVSHVSFLDNGSTEGDHIFAAENGDVFLSNSIVPSPLSGDSCGTDFPGTIVSRGFNVFELQDVDCPVAGKDEVVSDVGYSTEGPTENGGFTNTIDLIGESEAVDLIPEKKCKPAKGEDQRGFERPKGKRCDAGALERGAKP